MSGLNERSSIVSWANAEKRKDSSRTNSRMVILNGDLIQTTIEYIWQKGGSEVQSHPVKERMVTLNAACCSLMAFEFDDAIFDAAVGCTPY